VVLGDRGWSEELARSARLPPGTGEGLDRIAALASRLLGCEVGLVSLVEADRQFFLGQHGLPEPWCSTRQTPLSQSICHLVVTTGTPVQIDDTAADVRTRHHEARTVLNVGSYLGVPLFDDSGNPWGSLCAIDRQPHAWSSADLELLVDLATAARSEVRARVATSIAEQASRRVQVLADASEILSRTLEVEASLDATLDIVTPALASACVIYLPESANANRQVLLGQGGNAGRELADTPRHLEQLLASEPVQAVLAGRSPQRRIPNHTLEVSGDNVGRELLVIPLACRGDVLGVWLLEPPTDTGRFDDLDVILLSDLGRRAGITLGNARSFGHERDISLRLQRDLLPNLPDIDGLDVCAVYEPSDVSVEVGGDWYDIAVTPSGTVLATLGDVAGHDLLAAAAMGRLSAAIRCYGHDGLPPKDILTRLDGFSEHLLGGGLYATTICLELTREPQTRHWNLVLTNAGHPPPLLIPASGDPRPLEAPSHPAVGLGRPNRTALETRLQEGDILVLYSDGLIEHRHEHLDDAIQRLLHVGSSLDNTGPIDDYCHKLLVEARPSREDDIAILVLRPTPSESRGRPASRT
jgi:GAF domain-containing protein